MTNLFVYSETKINDHGIQNFKQLYVGKSYKRS